MSAIRYGCLVLADGSVFEGELIGAEREVASGEVVFNTSMSGYQEIITDPSYAGQIINFTYPHIGNYGVNSSDVESQRPHCRGIIIRELARRHSNWRSEGDLDSYLKSEGVPGIAGIDTRRLTRHIRNHGSMSGAFGELKEKKLGEVAAAELGTAGIDLVSQVTTKTPYTVGNGPWRVVVYDLGVKQSILEQLGKIATIEVVPADTTAEEVIETHFCLNDGALEGLRCRDIPAFSVQYHPEASPGPHDSRYLFDQFAELMSSFHGDQS
jgi:carbamoyl-phosphate synthase small subunit